MILETSIQPKEVDSVFTIAFLGMNPDERETWTDRLKWYESFRLNPSQPKTFMERVKSGKDVFDWIRRITAKALNENEAHPDKSSWKEELEQSIPALQKALQHNEERTKGKFLTAQESKALRDTRQALSDAQFLLAYASGLVNKSKEQKAKKTTQTYTYDGDKISVRDALQSLFEKGYLTQREKNGKKYFCLSWGLDDKVHMYYEIKRILMECEIEGTDDEVITNFLNEIDFRTYDGKTIINKATALYDLCCK